MSSGSVTISYTTIAEVALVAALVGGIAYIGSSKSANAPHPTHATLAPQANTAATKKPAAAKNKKKKSSSAAAPAAAAVVEPVVEVATAVKDHVVHAANSAAQQPAVKQAVQQAQKVVQDVSESVSASTEPKKKASKKNKGGNKAAPASDLKPDATKHAEQKIQSGDAGADMVDPEVDSKPQVARVMKVVGGKAGAQANGNNTGGGDDGWERADAFDDDEGGWESVVSKKPSRPSTPSLANGSSSTANDRVVPGMPAAALTKKQRENANKKAKEQSLKEQQNREQEDRLREYRREQEKAKLAADQAARARQRPKSQNFFGAEPVAPAGSSKVLSGGMTASLDPSTGSLVWE